MKFEETPEQIKLRKALRAFLRVNAPMEVVRDAAEQQDGFAAQVWSRLISEMELTATAIDTEHGGVGGSFADLAVVLQELGRTLLPVPFLSTTVAASAVSACQPAPARDSLLEQVSGGGTVALALDSTRVAVESSDTDPVLNGVADYVTGFQGAAALLIAVDGQNGGLFVIELGDQVALTFDRQPTLDQTRPMATVNMAGARASRLGGSAEVRRARDLLAAATAQESLGGAERCLEETVEYMKQREQFGHVIGSFQALKHRCAELLVMIERARAAASYVAWAVDAAPDELHVSAPLALALSSETYMRVAAESIQLRGGIGFTWDANAHLYFKRAKTLQLVHGLPPRLRAEAAARAGII